MAKKLGLEAPHLTGRCDNLSHGAITDEPAHRRITTQGRRLSRPRSSQDGQRRTAGTSPSSRAGRSRPCADQRVPRRPFRSGRGYIARPDGATGRAAASDPRATVQWTRKCRGRRERELGIKALPGRFFALLSLSVSLFLSSGRRKRRPPSARAAQRRPRATNQGFSKPGLP